MKAVRALLLEQHNIEIQRKPILCEIYHPLDRRIAPDKGDA